MQGVPGFRYRPGDIVWVKFPFWEKPQRRKTRPALVLETLVSTEGQHFYRCAKITTSTKVLTPNSLALPAPPCRFPSFLVLDRTYDFVEEEFFDSDGSIGPELWAAVVALYHQR